MAKPPRKRVPRKPATGGRARASPVPRGRQARGAQERALADVAAVLEALDRPAAVIGGIAVIAWGYARFTADIDCAIAASGEDSVEVLTRFEAGGFQRRIADPIAFAEENLVLLLRHRKTGVDVDISLAQLEFEDRALRRAVNKPFGKTRVRVPTLSDLLIYKLIAGRPKDHQDVEELLALGLAVDEHHVEATLGQFDELLDTDRRGDWTRLRNPAR